MKIKTPEHHRLMVTNHLNSLFSRHEFFLKKIIECCSETKRNWGTQQEDKMPELNHYFDAYLNSFQSIKDSLKTALNEKIEWSFFEGIPYRKFMKEARNASTHDGFSIINSTIDGKYYISKDIIRFHEKKLIIIDVPNEDIEYICTHFSYYLFNKIKNLLSTNKSNLPKTTIEDIKNQLNPNSFKILIPEEVKYMMNNALKNDELINKIHQIFIHDNTQNEYPSINNILNVCKNYINI
ncbi:hypothetical protein [Acinetobacter calcoaceticus]|uniref:Abi-like protein n=1 Tax=Acinetobacter calcoaceticus TaxID=471 RepID=A0ABD5AKV5_ACICA|nr:hypothetical protein [Acinetobacter calcoaceticus]MDP9803210.1 hypothetical protein [Acinetobacter calcoaceticus]